jgi:hypothetical protein
VEAAVAVKNAVQSACRSAWFSAQQTVRGDTSFVVLSFWENTETPFYRHLERFAEALQQASEFPDDLYQEIVHQWHDILCRESRRLFEVWVLSSEFVFEDPERVARAHHQLQKTLNGSQLRVKILGMVAKTPSQSAKKRNKP